MFIHDIPTELVLNESYTDEQLVAFLCENPSSVVVSTTVSELSLEGKKEHRVIQIQNGYVHSRQGREYQAPGQKQTIYYID